MEKEKTREEIIRGSIFTAMMADGSFCRKRANTCFGDASPEERADQLESYVNRHLHEKISGITHEHSLFRIF